MTPTDELAARYGTTSTRRKRTRVTVIALVVVLLVGFATWAAVSVLRNQTASLAATDIGFHLVDDRTVTVTFRISVPDDTAVSCAIQALNKSYGVVGYSIVDLPPSEHRTTTYTETVRTVEPATTGLIDSCWLS